MPANQPVATRPLAIQINGTWYTYGWDLTKNICELYSTAGAITTSYTYAPFGQVTASGAITQPIQWSSEVWDSELGLVYYNWRYYNRYSATFSIRDSIFERGGCHLYRICDNSPIFLFDILGNSIFHISEKNNFKYEFKEPFFAYNGAGEIFLLPEILYSLYVFNRKSAFSYDAHIILDNDSALKRSFRYSIIEACKYIYNNPLKMHRYIYVSHDDVISTESTMLQYVLGRYIFKVRVNVMYNQRNNKAEKPYLIKALLHIEDFYDFDLREGEDIRNAFCAVFGSVHLDFECSNNSEGFPTVGERLYEIYLDRLNNLETSDIKYM